MTTSPTTTEQPEQLTLLPASAVPVRFRLDETTRRRGLAHIAEIRAQLERASSARATASGRTRPRPATPTVPHAA